jgi:hypothetical protein
VKELHKLKHTARINLSDGLKSAIVSCFHENDSGFESCQVRLCLNPLVVEFRYIQDQENEDGEIGYYWEDYWHRMTPITDQFMLETFPPESFDWGMLHEIIP